MSFSLYRPTALSGTSDLTLSTGTSTTFSKNWTDQHVDELQLRKLQFSALSRPQHLTCTATGTSRHPGQNHGNLPLRHDRDEDLVEQLQNHNDANRRHPPTTDTIQEPALALLGAALDECSVNRSIALYRLWGPRGLGHSLPKGATPHGQVLEAILGPRLTPSFTKMA